MKDKQIEDIIKREAERQKSVINLIASENYVSKDVLEALGSELTNKYAEGYSGARYYGGNEIIDELEDLTKKRALETFGLDEKEWAVNVQPLSGSPANLAVYLALIPNGCPPEARRGKIMGMSLDHGGHLTHGHKASATGKFFTPIPFGVDKETELLNYEKLEEQAKEEQPDIVVSGFTAYPRIIDFAKFRKVADAGNALLMTDMSHIAGLIAGGVYPSPFDYADVVTTTVHKTLRGPRAALIFSRKDDRNLPAGRQGLNEKIDKAVFPGLQGGPHANQIAAVAVALKEAQSDEYKEYAKQVVKNAKTLADKLKELGWRIISGGTDSHLLLVDTWMDGKGIGGKEASDRLEAEGIIVNKNTIPFDSRSPVDPSGLRLGSAAETTLGKTEKDFVEIAERIDKILKA